jgi:hypothetical protein
MKRKPDPCAGCLLWGRDTIHQLEICRACARKAKSERDAWRDIVYQFAEERCERAANAEAWRLASAMDAARLRAKHKAGRP